MSRAKPTWLAMLALVFAARAQEHGRLLGVKAGGDGQTSAIELLGDRPLSFTTLKLAGPPRVVVDFADTDVAAEERDLLVEDGTVRRVVAAAAGSRTARVVIELSAEAEFEVRAVGNSVEVRVPRAAPLVAQATEPEPQQPAAPEAAPAKAEPAARGETEAEKRASLPKVALVGSRRAAPEMAPADDAAAKKKREREQRVAAYAESQRAAAEKVAASQRAVRERAAARRRASADAKRLAAAEKKQRAAEKARLAAAQRKARAEKAAAEKAQAAAARKERAEQTWLAAAEKKVRAEQDRKARAQARPQRKLAMASASPARTSITGIGFRPAGGGEVIVRSDHPLEYGISGEENVVLLHLPGAGIPLLNNRRPLDTHFFEGPVQRVVPVAVAGGTDVRIELKGHTEYQLAQTGSVLTVTFAAPQ